jgi:hypothetical protein
VELFTIVPPEIWKKCLEQLTIAIFSLSLCSTFVNVSKNTGTESKSETLLKAENTSELLFKQMTIWFVH